MIIGRLPISRGVGSFRAGFTSASFSLSFRLHMPRDIDKMIIIIESADGYWLSDYFARAAIAYRFDFCLFRSGSRLLSIAFYYRSGRL